MKTARGALTSLSDPSPRAAVGQNRLLRPVCFMSAGAQPTVVANDAAAPGGSEALPTADECAFGREYCRRYRKRRLQGFDDGLLLAGELQRGLAIRAHTHTQQQQQ